MGGVTIAELSAHTIRPQRPELTPQNDSMSLKIYRQFLQKTHKKRSKSRLCQLCREEELSEALRVPAEDADELCIALAPSL
jgi:hypothetical protein